MLESYNNLFSDIASSARKLKNIFDQLISTAVIIGSGLNTVLAKQNVVCEIAYADLPGLTAPTTLSHRGIVTIIEMESDYWLVFNGRSHLYEGLPAPVVAANVFLTKALSIDRLIITNAAGGLNANFRPGDVMLIEDHLNMTGHNPIIGINDYYQNQFCDMSDAYSKAWRSHLLDITDINLVKGNYAGVLGPSLETSAERRMLRMLGADAVGMSSVIEVIAANYCGISVLGLSAITNMATGDEHQQADSVEEMLNNAAIASNKINALLRDLLK